ncbi:MAG: response regulator transcription factor [Clostridia bacterium]|nr:response regulator transcription factor [Clostridia bacterium]
MKTVAVIDDDVYIGDMLETLLKCEGYGVVRAYSGTEALMLLSQTRPDIILLDLMLPGLSGEELLPSIKNIPVIVVSAKLDIENKVELLMGGACDYVTKPFDPKELLARIAVQLRTNLPNGDTENELALDFAARGVTVCGTQVHLTRTEYAILKILMQNPNRVVSKSLILDRISQDTPDCTENSLKVHISNLHRKLRAAGGRDYIESVWGIGFRLL